MTEKEEELAQEEVHVEKLEIVDQPVDFKAFNDLVENEFYLKILQDFMPIYEEHKDKYSYTFGSLWKTGN